MILKAIITELKQKRTGLDNEFTLKLQTEDNKIMVLSAYPSDTVFNIEINPEENHV